MLNFESCVNEHQGYAVFHAPEMPDAKRWEINKLPYRPGTTIFVRVASVSPKKASKDGNRVIVENLDGIGMWETSVNALSNIKREQMPQIKMQNKQLINSTRRRKVKKNKIAMGFRRERDENHYDE